MSKRVSDRSPAAATASSPPVAISSRARVIFPDTGGTKGDLADYYAAIAPLMLPFAADRPITYWWWGNLAALAVSAGPALGAGLASLRRSADRVGLLLVGAAVLMVALADASGMSKAEVERIWLPFIPWLTLCCAMLPDHWRRWGLGLQVLSALVVQHLFYTAW